LIDAGKLNEAHKLANKELKGVIHKKRGGAQFGDYGAQQTMGDLFISVEHKGELNNYKRELDITNGEGKVSYETALELVRKSLAINAYDGEANYLLGLICRDTGDNTTSKSGFSIAMGDIAYKSSAATELANLFLIEKDWNRAERYALKALAFNQYNLDALQTLALVKRKMGKSDEAKKGALSNC